MLYYGFQFRLTQTLSYREVAFICQNVMGLCLLSLYKHHNEILKIKKKTKKKTTTSDISFGDV